jgi:hypothetical protein
MVLVDYIGFFKLKADVLSLYPMHKTSLHIFDQSFLDIFLQMLHQDIRNCLYFDWLFTHYVVMSYFYLYII